MKMLSYVLTTAMLAGAVPSVASAADLGGDYPPPRDAYVEDRPPPPPRYYEEDAPVVVYRRYPRPYPYYAAYPYWGPRYHYWGRPYWRAHWGGRGWGRRW